jgi:excisionase family DNA binding protein
MSRKTMLTTQEAADKLNVAYQTVMAWIYQGKFPNVRKEDTPRGSYYLIPKSDIDSFEKPARGRPPKPKDEQELENGNKKRRGKK